VCTVARDARPRACVLLCVVTAKDSLERRIKHIRHLKEAKKEDHNPELVTKIDV
jgi:hypothetical protein